MPDGATDHYTQIAARPAGLGDALTRGLDIGVSALGLIFVLPALVAIVVAIRLFDPGPVIFAHRRIGMGGREFFCLKFRSMTVDSQARLQALLATSASARREWDQFHKLSVDPRISRLGAFLRASSLDELPQLVNVLRGDMSLVGPRPIVQAEARRYGRYFAHYRSVRPGVTGLWQVLGRNRVSYRRRVAMDVLYIRRRSLGLHLWLLAVTVPAVLLRRGAV